ncbi:MAG: hypothetical protein ACXWN1_29290 [Thermoanaerobaculia bacterium]
MKAGSGVTVAVIPSVTRDLRGWGGNHAHRAPPAQVPRSTLGMTARMTRSDRTSSFILHP